MPIPSQRISPRPQTDPALNAVLKRLREEQKLSMPQLAGEGETDDAGIQPDRRRAKRRRAGGPSGTWPTRWACRCVTSRRGSRSREVDHTTEGETMPEDLDAATVELIVAEIDTSRPFTEDELESLLDLFLSVWPDLGVN